jgi:homogentisate 1,2-dioxygenase
MFGTLKFGPKDYLVIPKGTIYTIVMDELARTTARTTSDSA